MLVVLPPGGRKHQHAHCAIASHRGRSPDGCCASGLLRQLKFRSATGEVAGGSRRRRGGPGGQGQRRTGRVFQSRRVDREGSVRARHGRAIGELLVRRHRGEAERSFQLLTGLWLPSRAPATVVRGLPRTGCESSLRARGDDQRPNLATGCLPVQPLRPFASRLRRARVVRAWAGRASMLWDANAGVSAALRLLVWRRGSVDQPALNA